MSLTAGGSPIEAGSLRDLQSAAYRSQEIYDSYYDSLGSEPVSIRILLNVIKQLHDILTESDAFLRDCNRPYPAPRPFRRILDDSNALIGRNCRVGENDSDGSGSPTGRSLFWLRLTAQSEQRARSLCEGLQLELQKFISFILILAL
jgi:hypothetical protein